MNGYKKRLNRIAARIGASWDGMTDQEADEIWTFFEPRIELVESGGDLSPEDWQTWDRYTKRLKEAWGL